MKLEKQKREHATALREKGKGGRRTNQKKSYYRGDSRRKGGAFKGNWDIGKSRQSLGRKKARPEKRGTLGESKPNLFGDNGGYDVRKR